MPDTESLMDLATALAACGGISDSTRRRDPGFPKPVVLSRNRHGRPIRIAFVESEVRAYIRRRIAHSRGLSEAA